MNKLYVVGIGPGAYKSMTVEAIETLKECSVIVGYSVYVDLIREYFPNKEYVETGMRKETERCQAAIDLACKGQKVAVVCSGDGVVYGMAGLLMELGAKEENLEVEVVAGVTAALSGGAELGAPLGHDFAIISLSDLMTPWELIEKRLAYAAMADMVICLYNPSSKKRTDYLEKACTIILEHRKKETICGFVKNIARKGQEKRILTLEELKNTKVDMFTTVFIGNSQTKHIKNQMVTPRGYQIS